MFRQVWQCHTPSFQEFCWTPRFAVFPPSCCVPHPWHVGYRQLRSCRAPRRLPRITRPSVASQHLAKVFNNGRAAVVPPRGRSIRRPPLGGAQRAEPSKLITQIIRSQKFSTKLYQLWLLFEFPLSKSLRRSPGTTADLAQKKVPTLLFAFFFDFFAFQNAR